MAEGSSGSFDDRPGEVRLPGFTRQQTMTPGQRRALDLLEELDRIWQDRKAAAADWKEKEEAAAEEAWRALDLLDLAAGQLGRAIFHTKVTRKLVLKMEKKRKGRRGRPEAPGEGAGEA